MNEVDGIIHKAIMDQKIFAIPERDYQAYREQYHIAKRRGIPFHFTLLQWRLWWRTELAKLEPGAKRGRGKDNYVMARYGDRGAYEPGNVFATRPAGNMADRDPAAAQDAMHKATHTRNLRGKPRGYHLRIRGDGHPKAKAVTTPAGRYGSIALASEAHGITRQAGHYRVRSGVWRICD